MEELLLNITGIVAVLVLLGTFFLHRKIQYIAHAIFILALSVIHLLFYIGVLPFNIANVVVVKYMLTLVVVMSGRELIRSGILEEEKALKRASIGIGIAVILAVILPALVGIGALSMDLPKYPWFIDSFLYVVSSILLIIGVFIAKE